MMAQTWNCPGYTQRKPDEGLLVHVGAENDQNLKPIFKTMHNNRITKDNNASKIIAHRYVVTEI